MLTSKLETGKLAISNVSPELPFSIALLPSQAFSEEFHSF